MVDYCFGGPGHWRLARCLRDPVCFIASGSFLGRHLIVVGSQVGHAPVTTRLIAVAFTESCAREENPLTPHSAEGLRVPVLATA
jgi:hypothetical protein